MNVTLSNDRCNFIIHNQINQTSPELESRGKYERKVQKDIKEKIKVEENVKVEEKGKEKGKEKKRRNYKI